MTVEDQLSKRLRRRGRGTVFTPKDFLDLSSREAVAQALVRLTEAQTLKRLGRGLYYYPKVNKRLGIAIPPDPDEIADALARQTGSRIAPSGATAANRLGLSTQVPAKPVYLTDGQSRRIRTSDLVVELKHVAPKELPIGRRTSATVLQALRHLGKDAIDQATVNQIRKALTPKQRSRLLHDARYTTDWIADAVRKIAAPDDEANTHG